LSFVATVRGKNGVLSYCGSAPKHATFSEINASGYQPKEQT
jgi:hypothetical protein